MQLTREMTPEQVQAWAVAVAGDPRPDDWPIGTHAERWAYLDHLEEEFFQGRLDVEEKFEMHTRYVARCHLAGV